MKNYKNAQHFLENYNRDNIIFCYGNYAVADMVKNLIESAMVVNMPIVLFALDKKISNALTGICDVVNYFDKEIEQDKFYEYGKFTDEYKELMMKCWEIGVEILKCGKSYIYLDVDIVVKKNFEDDILNHYKNTKYDCLIQRHRNSACAGFYSLKSNEKTLNMFPENFWKEKKYLHYVSDQVYFNSVILKNKILDIKLLSETEYPVGKYYYANFKRINDECKMIHFNWIIGYEKKIAKMKEFNLWKQ